MNPGKNNTYKERIESLRKENKKLSEKLSALTSDKQSAIKELKKAQKLLSKIPCPVILVQDGKIIFANEMTWKQLGYAKEELLDHGCLHLIHAISSDFSKNVMLQYFSESLSGKAIPNQFEIYLRKKDGKPLCCDVHLTKIRYEGRNSLLVHLTGIDHRKQEEKRVRQSQKIKTVAMMASGLNQDVNKVLKSLNEHFSLFQEMAPVTDAGMLQSMKRIRDGVEIVDRISRHLECLTKSGHDPGETALFDLNEVARNAVSEGIEKWKNHHMNSVDVKTYLRTFSSVRGSPGEIRDALVYLILNAFDAMPKGGEVYLTTEENSGFAWIYIQDSGTGIADELKDLIFDPFFTTKGSRHTGLGLSLAHAIIRRHGGEVDVLSRKGQGSIFIVKIPLSAETVAQSPVKPIRNRIRDARILIISGGSIMMDLLRQEIVGKGGRITEVYACVEGLKLIKRIRFALIIVDLDIQDLRVADFVSYLKSAAHTVPVVLANTGNTGDASMVSAKLGADLIIEKPLDMDRMCAIISRIMDDTESTEQPAYEPTG